MQYVAFYCWVKATPGTVSVSGATVKVCGVAVGEAAGVQLGASLADRYVVNVGTVDVRPLSRQARLGMGRSVAD